MAPVLQTTRFRLRPFNQYDADNLYTLLKEERVVTAHPAHPVTSQSEANSVLKAMDQETTSGSALYWLIEEKTSQRFTGRIGFKHINHQNNSAALMVEVLPELWGENILYETGRAVIAYGFSQLQLHRIEAQVVPEHSYMHRFLERVGFHLEGTVAVLGKKTTTGYWITASIHCSRPMMPGKPYCLLHRNTSVLATVCNPNTYGSRYDASDGMASCRAREDAKSLPFCSKSISGTCSIPVANKVDSYPFNRAKPSLIDLILCQ